MDAHRHQARPQRGQTKNLLRAALGDLKTDTTVTLLKAEGLILPLIIYIWINFKE